MAVILNIETSGATCSTALTSDGMILTHHEEFNGRNHAARLSGFIKASLDKAESMGLRLDAVAVSMGPGSYTGLRIGLSEAKGLAYGLGIPLIGIDTLKIMAVGVMFRPDADPDALFVPMVDARRRDVFATVYDWSLQELVAPGPLTLEPATFSEVAPGSPMMVFGSGSGKAREILDRPGLSFIEGIEPLAVDMLPLAEQAWQRSDFEDVAYSTPRYLKEFYTEAKPR